MNFSRLDFKTILLVFSIIFFSSFFYSLSHKKKKKLNKEKERIFLVPYLVSLLIVILFVGLQKSNADFENYYYLYNYKYGPEFSPSIELIFRFLNYILFKLGAEYKVLTLVMASITYICFFRGLDYFSEKYSINYFCSMFILLSCIFLVSFTLIRQMCATSMCFLSLKYFDQKKKKSFIIILILSIMFHPITLIFAFALLFSFLTSKKNGFLYGIVLIVMFYLICFSISSLLPLISKFLGKEYFYQYYSPQPIGLGNLIKKIPTIIFVFLAFPDFKKHNLLKFLLGFLVFDISIVFIYYLFPIFARITYAFSFSWAVLIPFVIKKKFGDYVSFIVSITFGFLFVIVSLLFTSWITEYLMPIQFM